MALGRSILDTVRDHLFRPAIDGPATCHVESHSVWPFVFVLGALSFFFAFAASLYFRRHPLPLRAEVALYCCLILLLAFAMIPAMHSTRVLAARWLCRRGGSLLLIGLWLVPYLIYAAGTGDFRWTGLARLLAVCALPVFIYRAAPVRNLAVLSWQDGIAWTWLVMAVVLRQMNGIWNVPVSLDFMTRLFLIGVGSWCWVFVRPVPGFGYCFSISARTVGPAILNFLGFALIAIPVGFALRFAGWNPRWQGLQTFFLSYVEILVFIAWLEELFFRGFLQSLLAQSLRSPLSGQLFASLAFGLSHVLLAPAPNWRYVALASVAGWFYGSAFRQSANLLAPSLTHALVDAVWRTWFLRG